MNDLIASKNSQIELTIELLKNLTQQYGNSFYLFNRDGFAENLHKFKTSFEKFYSNVELGYSFKTNYIPAVCQIAHQNDAYAEVVSALEYELALKVGYNGSDIIFNGPLKESDELCRAFDRNSIVHFDSYEEIKTLKEYLKDGRPDQSIRCALRCNFDIGEDSISRFGFDAESGEVEKVYNELFAMKGCNPIGIHCHFSTSHRSLKSFQERATKLVKLARKIFKEKPLNYIDIGGGFFGEMPKYLKDLFPYQIPSFTDYGEVVGNIMKENFPKQKTTLILEPGAAVVAETMSFICRVASIKQIQSKSVVTLSGSLHNVRPTGSDGNIPFRIIKSGIESNKLENALIGGYTCMETDIIDRSFSGDLSVGDYLIFDNMGAYNIVFKPPFIKESPPILMYRKKNDDIRFKVIRDRESLGSIFSSYKF